jgi:hypothetical protein
VLLERRGLARGGGEDRGVLEELVQPELLLHRPRLSPGLTGLQGVPLVVEVTLHGREVSHRRREEEVVDAGAAAGESVDGRSTPT